VLEHAVGVGHVLDRLQEHDAVDVAGPQLDHVALERDLRVLGPRVLERLGIGVDADDRGRRASELGAAVALAAREVDDPAAADALGDPAVHDQVALEPVVLLGDVRERALAGQVQRRDAGRLVALDVEVHRGQLTSQPIRGARAARILIVNVRVTLPLAGSVILISVPGASLRPARPLRLTEPALVAVIRRARFGQPEPLHVAFTAVPASTSGCRA
jgi:hypothetical protein